MNHIKLPSADFDSKVSVENAMAHRRSIREYKQEPLSLNELSLLLWAAQGTTALGGFRTTPSAGALYPLEVYAVVGNVTDLAQGIYRYISKEHSLTKVGDRDLRAELSEAALDQSWMKGGAVILVFSAVAERTTGRYGQRGIPYIHEEVGHAAQNVYLEAAALGLGTVAVGAFDDKKMHQVMKLKDGEQVLYLMPVGRK